MTLQINSGNLEDTQKLARDIGQKLSFPAVINLVGDLGAGKTTFTKGLALGLGCSDEILSPSFPIMRKYSCGADKEIHHYDFYRLSEAGLMEQSLVESVEDKDVVTVIEWAEAVGVTLPGSAIEISITVASENSRLFSIKGPSDLLEGLQC